MIRHKSPAPILTYRRERTPILGVLVGVGLLAVDAWLLIMGLSML